MSLVHLSGTGSTQLAAAGVYQVDIVHEGGGTDVILSTGQTLEPSSRLTLHQPGAAVTARTIRGGKATLDVVVTPSAPPQSASYLSAWKASTAYAAGQAAVSPRGDVVRAIKAFTSGATYDRRNWEQPREVARANIGAGTVLDDFTDLSQWRLAGTGTPTVDTTQAAKGAPVALKVETGGTGSTYTMERDVLMDGYGKMVSFMLLSDSAAASLDFGVMVGGTSYSTTSFAKSGVVINGSLGGASYVFQPGIAHRVTIPFTMLAQNGTVPPTESQIRDVRALHLGFKDQAGGASTFYLWDFRVHDAAQVAPGICWVFDDARYDWYVKALPILEAAGFTSVNAVPTALVAAAGQSGTVISGVGRCAWADLLDAQNRGHQLVNHTQNHTGLLGVSATTARNEILNGRADLIANGADPVGANFFVWPGGQFDSTSLPIAKTIARASRAVTSTNNSVNGNNYEGPILADLPRLRTLYMVNTIPVSEATGVIDRIVSRGGHAIFTFHSIADTNAGADSFTYLTSDFQAIVSYAAAAGLKSYSMSDLWGR